MKSQKQTVKPRQLSSLAIGIFIMFSSFAVLNITSMNVLAINHENLIWADDINRTVTENRTFPNTGYDSTHIRVEGGNLTITCGFTLKFNDNVTLEIINPATAIHKYGIIIQYEAKFEIDSPNFNTTIESDPLNEERTYFFWSAGTIEFNGATVERLYGDPNNKATTGGIRNWPTSVCNLTNCNIKDADTNSIYGNGTSLQSVELNIVNITIDQSDSSTLDGSGIYITDYTNTLIDAVTVKNCAEYGIKCIDADNVTIQNGTVIKDIESDGIYLDNSIVTIKDCYINNNTGEGIELVDGSVSTIEGNEIEWNNGYGIKADNSVPIIKNNPIITRNRDAGIYLKDVTNVSAIVENNTINSNIGTGIYCEDTKILIINNTINSNGDGLIFYDSMEIGQDNSNWTASGLWHPVSNEASNVSWNISHDGFWSYWFGLDETGSYNTTVQYSNFSTFYESVEFQFNGTDYHIAYLRIHQDANITNSSVEIEGDYLALANNDTMKTNNSYNIHVTTDSTWTGDVGSENLTAGWNRGVNYSNVWSYNKTVQAAFSESLTAVNYTEVNQGPTNPTIDVGDDGDNEWSYSGEFTTSDIMNDTTISGKFSQELQDYIDANSPGSDGFYNVPLNITSESFGSITLSELEVISEHDQFNGSLTSILIDLQNVTIAKLRFWDWFETDGLYDIRKLTVQSNTSMENFTLSGTAKTWTEHVYDISNFTGSKVNITFFFDTVNATDNSYQGWYIDEVEVMEYGTSANGIHVEGEVRSRLINNTINENNGNGIYCIGNGLDIISDSTLSGNKWYSIQMYQVDDLNAWDQPVYTPGSDKGYYIWVDEDDWHIRWSGDGSSHDFDGNITFVNLIGSISASAINLDATDSYNITSSYINFNSEETNSEEGFDFSYSGDFVSFELWVDDVQDEEIIWIGLIERNPDSAEFELTTPLEINNCIMNETRKGIELCGSNPYVHDNNISIKSVGYAISNRGLSSRGSNIIFENNTISFTSAGYGVHLNGYDARVYLKGNKITSGSIAIYMVSSSPNGMIYIMKALLKNYF